MRSTTKPEPKPERVWDGRGTALDDARMTSAAGRVADDLRLKETHMRVMAHVGRQNATRGWLRVSQSELSDRWALHRSTVNRAFRDLVGWGYLKQLTQEKAGESFCLYKVVLDDDAELPPEARTRGVCSQERTPDDGGSALVGAHMCALPEHTGALRESAPPNIDTDKPIIADSPPLPPEPSRAQGGEGSGQPVREGRDIRWASRWTTEARELLAEYRDVPHRAALAGMVAEVCGVLQPPRDADPAAWLRQAAVQLAGRSDAVLAELAARMIAERGRDVPPVSDLMRWADEIARRHATAAVAAAETKRRAALDAAAIARLAPGAEPGAEPQRLDALDLRRSLVGQRHDGAALDAAWLGDLLVLDRSDRLLRLSVGHAATRNYLATSQFSGWLIDAARALWPRIASVEIVTHKDAVRGAAA